VHEGAEIDANGKIAQKVAKVTKGFRGWVYGAVTGQTVPASTGRRASLERRLKKQGELAQKVTKITKGFGLGLRRRSPDILPLTRLLVDGLPLSDA
jgi:hypothetical protein